MSLCTSSMLIALVSILVLQVARPVKFITATPLTDAGFTTEASVSPAFGVPGSSPTASVIVTSQADANVLVDVEVSDPTGTSIVTQVMDNQFFVAGEQRTYSVSWTVSAQSSGTDIVKIGLFSPGWGVLYHWNNYAGTFAIADDAPGVSRIMPLGDSLTDGFNFPGGYRPPLLNLINADHLTINFVGSLANGPPSLTDREHEGHAGWRIDQVAASVEAWLSAYKPDVVLLMVGTNDVVQDYDLVNAPTRLGALLDLIANTAPDTQILVASIPPWGGDTDYHRVDAYNAAILGLLAPRIIAGAHLTFVDIFSVIGKGDQDGDFTHLNPFGDAKVAAAWYASLKPFIAVSHSP